MENERLGLNVSSAYPHVIDRNCFPHCDDFLENGYTKEEMKMVNETRKIYNDNDIKITTTAVRIPVSGGHSESVNVEFEKEFVLEDAVDLMKQTDGVIIDDDVMNNRYPMPLYVAGKDDIYVGRIRKDDSVSYGLNLWIVADNLRKGAATNAIQIAEYMLDKGFLS